MSEPVGIVTITKQRGRESVDSELRVRTLRDLYDACRAAPPSRLVRVVLKADEGEVRLNFASFIQKA
jgi:hypothetical protein